MGFLNNQIIPPNTWPGNNTENDMYDMLTITSGWNGVPNFQTTANRGLTWINQETHSTTYFFYNLDVVLGIYDATFSG